MQNYRLHLGAIAFVFLLVYWCGLLDNPAFAQALSGIATAKVSMPWIMVMLKGIGANWLVCLALWLAMAGTSLLEKAFGCWLPVMAFVALGFEHSIANMFFLPAGMLSGAEITVWQAIWDNLIPATIGNIIGGALLVGTLHSRLYPA
ncbi:MAG: formate/nitrite transporter family protein [Bacteroidales bacterium]|nr:formate/nitrite transporter family protein [Bacteroidales bacterium]